MFFRRVGENSSRSTSTGDLRKVNRTEASTDSQSRTEEGSGRQVTRKNSLRDRIRQLPTPFTLERRRPAIGRSTQEANKSRKKSTGEQQQPGDKSQAKQEVTGHQQQQQQQMWHVEEKTFLVSATTNATTSVSTTTPTVTTPASTPAPTITLTTITPTSLTTTTTANTTTTTTTTTGSHGTIQISSHQASVPSHHQAATEVQAVLSESSGASQRQRPRYMLPTRASSQHSPVRPSSIDLDSRSASNSNKGSLGRWNSTPPSSGRCSPSKLEVRGRRGSVGGESPIRSGSPRRGSLDCLAWPHSRALSPPISPLHTPSRSSQGSTSSLLASEEYREGSPEKLWISSLRTDTPRSKGTTVRCTVERKEGRSRSGSGENSASDRLKRAALYHPPLLRGRTDPMKPAFELVLDPYSGQVVVDSHLENVRPSKTPSEVSPPDSVGHQVTITLNRLPQRQSPYADAGTPSRPEVPPRTKFLSPSERTLPASSSSSSLPSSPPSIPTASTLSSSTLSVNPAYTNSSTSSPTSHITQVRSSSTFPQSSSPGSSHSTTTRHVPSLTIRTSTEETEAVRTPLKVNSVTSSITSKCLHIFHFTSF